MNAPLRKTTDDREWLAPRLDDIEIKFAKEGDADVGTIEGYASIFGEVDSGNDEVVKGAFAKSLKERRKADRWRIPMFLGHSHGSVPIGVWTDITEDGKGLKVKGKIILVNEDARQLHAVLLAGGDMGLSIGYRATHRCYRSPDGKEHADWVSGAVRLLKELDLREISITAMPMLDPARITSVKEDAAEITDEEKAAAAAREAAANNAGALIRALDASANSFALKHALESAAQKFGR